MGQSTEWENLDFCSKCSTVEKRIAIVFKLNFSLISMDSSKLRRQVPFHLFLFEASLLHHFYCIYFHLYFKSGIPGYMHDTAAARKSTALKDVVKNYFCIADTGYEKVSFCVPGLLPNELKTNAHRIYDKITRKEQKPVEHINNFIKKCMIISNDSKFRHNNLTLFVGAVFICCCLYNYKKSKGWAYFPAEMLRKWINFIFSFFLFLPQIIKLFFD